LQWSLENNEVCIGTFITGVISSNNSHIIAGKYDFLKIQKGRS